MTFASFPFLKNRYVSFSSRTFLFVTALGSEFDVYFTTTALPPGSFTSDTPVMVTARPCAWITLASLARTLAAFLTEDAGERLTSALTPSNLFTKLTVEPFSVRPQPSGTSRR